MLSNLSLATDLALSVHQLPGIAKKSFGNLFITCLEYGKLAKEKHMEKIAYCLNPMQAQEILSQGKGIIFFCGHQANWEVLFLEGTCHMPGVAIGQPIDNPYLYRWILSIREKFGGKIFLPKQAVKEGLRALSKAKFLGIVGDQGMPEGGFCSPFLGRMAWTSPLPALLSYRSGCPIIVASTLRTNGAYQITYSDPIYPDKDRSMEEEIPRLMKQALSLLQQSILQAPEQWLWSHNRWKQQILGRVKKNYRQDAILVIVDPSNWADLFPHLKAFREVYPTEFLCFLLPKEAPQAPLQELQAELLVYHTLEEAMLLDYRFKLLFNFTPHRVLSRHFLKLYVFHALTLGDIQKLAKLPPSSSFEEQLKGALLHAR
jgi:KDO2-lipid IV(A) lauroyltransferase